MSARVAASGIGRAHAWPLDDVGNTGDLARQAVMARALGSSFIGNVLEAAQRQLRHAPRTAGIFARWTGDPSAAALAMRLNGALHALARRRTPRSLKRLYDGEHDDFDGAIASALASEDDFIAEWMRHPTQTNEVGRTAALMAALMVAQQDIGLPYELLELGSSSGLNLNLARYGFELGGVAAGAVGSPVEIVPDWFGAAPPLSSIELVAARGVDLHPLDPADDATRERLLSFVWADQRDRAERLERALMLARHHPPRVDRADAKLWLAERLGETQTPGICRVIFHSMVLQYLSPGERRFVRETIEEAGARASAERPLVWISFEWTESRSEVQLLLRCWPNGGTRHLAVCHPYGEWLRWLL